MDRTTLRQLLVLGAMYVTQGVVYGFAAFVLMPTLAQRGVSLEDQTGILALAGLPWVFKLAWGPVLDRFGGVAGGRAKRFAAIALLCVSASLFGLSAIEDPARSIERLGALWLLLNVALCLQDVATDAMALDVVAPGRRGVANGVMLGGHHVGLEGVGGMALGAVAAAHGLSTALLVQAIATALVAGVPIAMGSPVSRAAPVVRAAVGDAIRHVLSKRGLAIAGLAAVVLFADVLTASLSAPLLVDRLKWSPEAIAARLPPVLLVANVVGYAIAATLSDRIGHARTAALGALALGGAWVGFGVLEPVWMNPDFLVGFVVVQALVTALFYVGVHATLMDATEPAMRATHFAVLTTLLNLPRVVAPVLAPVALSHLGWSGLFVVAGLLQAGLALPLARVRAADHSAGRAPR